MSRFDVIVIGGGPAGERAAIQAAKVGKEVALVERERVIGGTGVVWGAVPSKTLRESALFVRSLTGHKLDGVPVSLGGELTPQDFMHREKTVVQRELDLINATLERWAVQVFKGHGRFIDPHTVELINEKGHTTVRLTAEIIVIATGSSPNRPADVPFESDAVFDSQTILHMSRIPASMIVLGAGVIGIEYASIFAALGIQVTLVDTRDRLLPYVDDEIVGILKRELRKLGMVILHNEHYQSIAVEEGDPPLVRVQTKSGNLLEAESLLYSVGRDGNTQGIGLEALGVEANSRGLLKVNENYQLEAHPHIYAVGDVIGYPALASTSMEQGRQAVRHAFSIEGPRLDISRLPFAVYSIPEVSYIGATERELIEKQRPYVVGRAEYKNNPRGQILGDRGGELKLLFDAETEALLGCHLVGSSASELVHIGQAHLIAGSKAVDIAEAAYNYPTLSDLYRHAALVAHVRAQDAKKGVAR